MDYYPLSGLIAIPWPLIFRADDGMVKKSPFHPPLQKGERGGFDKKETGKGSPPLLFRLPAPSQATRLAGVRAS
jgi:hypothetical protein